jgi:hypothetical protein
MRNERIDRHRTQPWRDECRRAGARFRMPVTDSWIGTGDTRLWAATDDYDDEVPTWVEGLRS